VVEDLIVKLERDNPHLENIRIFDTRLGRRVNHITIETKDPACREILIRVAATRMTLEVADPQVGMTTRYLLAPEY